VEANRYVDAIPALIPRLTGSLAILATSPISGCSGRPTRASPFASSIEAADFGPPPIRLAPRRGG
jgi:hypothetical protein